MCKEDVCFLCLTVKTFVSDIVKTKLQSIYEELTDLKIDANSFNVCGICCKRLEQSSQLLVMAKQTGNRYGVIKNSKFTTLECTDVTQNSVPPYILIKEELKVEKELKDMECSSMSMASTYVACSTALPSTSGSQTALCQPLDTLETIPPSSARFIECETSSPVRPRPRPRQALRKDEISAVINFGSDGSDESDEEGEVVAFIPRVYQSQQETPLDPEEEEVALESPEAGQTESNISEGPYSLYEFGWESFPNPPIPPESRRERFSEASGPKVSIVEPYDIFTAIWDRQFMEHVALETNRYAQLVAQKIWDDNNLHPHSRISRWHDTNADELYLYFAILIGLGVVVKNRFDEYWSNNQDLFTTPGFRVHMSYNRFQLLNKFIHFNNNDDMCTQELSASEAKLFKIQPVLTHLNCKFQNMYKLSQNIALDESLLKWKGWLDINQYIPNKTARVGIKSYEVCESQTGYLWRFQIHTYKKSPSRQLEDPLNASTPSIVLGLIQGLENKGHTLWMDNFYNSPILARRLKSWGIDCVGTLRTNRQFVPQVLHYLDRRSMTKGQITGLTSGDVDIMVWNDKNRVSMLSTYHGIAVKEIRDSTKPIMVLDYNIMMGGVDKKDQMLASYPMERKRTKVWYKKLFRRLLNVSVLNAFIIHLHNSSSSLTHYNFRKNLANTLLLKHNLNPPRIPHLISAATTQKVPVDITHRLATYPLHSNGYRKRLACKVCKKRVNTYCVGCKVFVCLDICFQTFHTQFI